MSPLARAISARQSRALTVTIEAPSMDDAKGCVKAITDALDATLEYQTQCTHIAQTPEGRRVVLTFLRRDE
jgi:hypothetical protein